MASAFNPYSAWLGISASEQPPHYYRLLNIALFETDKTRIEAAAQERLGQLRNYRLSKKKDAANKLIDEVIQARRCLLDPKKKVDYDRQLSTDLRVHLPAEQQKQPFDSKAQSSPTVNPAAPQIQKADRTKTMVKSPSRSAQIRPSSTTTNRLEQQQERKLKRKRKEQTIWISAAVGFTLILIVVLMLASGSDDQASKRSKKTALSQLKSDATEKEVERLEQQKSEPRAIEKNQRAEKKTKPTVQPTPLAPVFQQQPEPPENRPSSEPGEDANRRKKKEPSEAEQAEALLNAKGLEEGFNSQWKLAELTKAYEETTNASGNQSGSGNETGFQTELVRQWRHYFKTLREFYKRTNYQQHPASDSTAREAAAYLNSVGTRPFAENTEILQFTLEGGAPVQFQVPSDIPAISLTDKVQREVSTQPSSNPASNEASNEIAGLLRDGYQKLSEDAEVQAALKTVGGSLAETPESPESISNQSKKSASLSNNDDSAIDLPMGKVVIAGSLTYSPLKTVRPQIQVPAGVAAEDLRLALMFPQATFGVDGSAVFQVRGEDVKKDILIKDNMVLKLDSSWKAPVITLSIKTQIQEEIAGKDGKKKTNTVPLKKALSDLPKLTARIKKGEELLKFVQGVEKYAGRSRLKPEEKREIMMIKKQWRDFGLNPRIILTEKQAERLVEIVNVEIEKIKNRAGQIGDLQQWSKQFGREGVEAIEFRVYSLLNYEELKDQLTALEKKTKLSLGSFNKGAKEYIKQKKDLVKRIKSGEALYARRAKIQDGIQYPEDKTKYGQETDAKVTKPLQALKVQLQKLSKPDAAAMEDNLSRAEKLLAQIKATPEYAAHQKSIDGRAENIAKYHKGFEVQQSKMAQ